jgi:hypothetical protein
MKRWPVLCAAMLVRAWTRAYTAGTQAETRRRRRAEMESDIWESLHDPEKDRSTGIHMVVRLARGIPADTLWRLEQALAGGELMWRKYALLGAAVAAVTAIVWSLSTPAGLPSLPTLPAEPTPIYVVKRRTPPPPPPPPPSWEEFVAKVNGKQIKR